MKRAPFPATREKPKRIVPFAGPTKGGNVADQTPFQVNVGVSDLLEAGLHFGHQTKRWNPKMKRFIFSKRSGIYIIDLAKTLFHLKIAMQFVYETVAGGRQIIFVGTKKLTQDIVKDAATRCGQFFIVNRWLGGMLTNHKHVKTSITRLRKLEALETSGEMAAMSQKEASRLRSELARLQKNLGGIADMAGMPGALIVVDINREAIAIREARRMGIPVVALVDTNCDPDSIDYPIPGNDDALRCIKLIVNLFADGIAKAKTEYDASAAERKKQDAEAKPDQTAKPDRPARPPRPRRPRDKAPASKPAGKPVAKPAKPDAPAEKAAPAAAPEAPAPEAPAPAKAE